MTAASAPTLWSRILAGMRWTLLLRIVARGIGLVTTLIVAHFVPIAHLGSYGVILIGDQALQAITQLGFTTAIVQMRKDPTSYLDTAWTSQIIRASFIYSFEFLAAPYWCEFFHVPEATSAMRVLATGQVILGLHSISTAVLMRDLKFDKLFYTYSVESLAHAAITIPCAIYLQSIWAPIIGLLSGFSVRVLVSYFVSPVRARLRFDSAKAREMYQFTKWIGAYSIADFFLETTDNAVTGRVLGKVPLAHYRMAYQLATEGPLSLQWIVARVALPAFSSIQEDAARVRVHFRAMLGLVCVSMIPVCVALALLGPYVIPVLLGPSWAPAVPPLQILAFGALLRAVIDTAPPVLRALGKTRSDFVLKMVQVTVMCAALYPAGRYFGVVGIAWTVLGAAALATIPWAFIMRTRVGLSAADFVGPALAPTLAAGAGAAVIAFIPSSPPSWIALLWRGALFLAVYLIASYALYKVMPSSGAGAVMRAREAPH